MAPKKARKPFAAAPLCAHSFGPFSCLMSVSEATTGAEEEDEELLVENLLSKSEEDDPEGRFPETLPLSVIQSPIVEEAPQRARTEALAPFRQEPLKHIQSAPQLATRHPGSQIEGASPGSSRLAASTTGASSCSRPVSQAPPRLPVQDLAKLLREAILEGRFVEAKRRLDELKSTGESPNHYVDPATAERVLELAARFEESLDALLPSAEGGWTEERDHEDGLDLRFRLLSDRFQVVSSIIYHGHESLKAFRGLCDFESWCSSHETLTSEPKLLTKPSACDGLWQIKKRSSRSGREDNLLRVICLDALDEPLGALWFSAYTPSKESARSVLCTDPPPPEEGALRLSFWHSVFAITPLYDGGLIPSFKMTLSLCRRPSSAALIFSSVLRSEVKRLVQSFRDYLDSHKDLEWREVSEDKALFYSAVRRHLDRKAPVDRWPPLTESLKLTFKELSLFLPETWADGSEP